MGIEYTHFYFHDLKRKGMSDTEGDKLKASGHRNASVLNIYDVKLDVVKLESDAKGNTQVLLDHASATIKRVYERKPAKVTPIR